MTLLYAKEFHLMLEYLFQRNRVENDTLFILVGQNYWIHMR